MSWWSNRASVLQRSITEMENELPPEALGHLFPPQRAQQAAVLARQDIIGIYSLVGSLNQQISTIKWTLGLIAVLLGYLAYKL